MLAGGFLHLLPEAVSLSINNLNIYVSLIFGFILFFSIEKVLDFRHCHNMEEDHMSKYHTFRWMNLIGDAVHNFIDGLIIAVAFLINIPMGISTTIAVIAHEIPQEIGDFGVLVYGGFSRKKALYLNFLSAILAIIGGIVGYYLISYIYTSIIPYLLSFAAGEFLYIAASDLIPELKKENSGKKITLIMLTFTFGAFLMWLFKIIFSG